MQAVPEVGGFERTVGPLRLRRPTTGDLDAYRRLHTDPRTHEHTQEYLLDPVGSAIRLDEDLEHWREHGFGYLAVEDFASGRVVGWTGVRTFPGRDALNLYYRLDHAALGRGWGRLLARAVTESATEWLPEQRVRASVRTTNEASRRTAEAAGLVRIGLDEREGEPQSDLFELPRLAAPAGDEPGLRDAILDLWDAVNRAGGSVGFLPGATRADVEPVLDEHLDDTADGRAVLGVLRDPGGRILGLGWWQRHPQPAFGHVATLLRLQVDPDRRGRNLGRLLLAGMVRLARGMDGIELLRLDYRSGSGLGDFYAAAGWVETGRQPGGLRVAPGDDRDDVAMMRRVDGMPLVADGRT